MSPSYTSYPGASREAPYWDHDLNQDPQRPDSAEFDDCSDDFMGTSNPAVQVLAAPTAELSYQNLHNDHFHEGRSVPQYDNYAPIMRYYTPSKDILQIPKAQRPDTRVWRQSLPDRTRASTNVGFRRRSRGSWNLASTQRAPPKDTQNFASEVTGMEGPRAPAAPPPPPPPLPPPQSISSCTATTQADYRDSPTPEYYKPNNDRSYSARDSSHAWGECAAGLLSSPSDIPVGTNLTTTAYRYSFDRNVEATLSKSTLDSFSLSGTAAADSSPLEDLSFVGDHGYIPEPMDSSQTDILNGYSCEKNYPFFSCSTIHDDSQQSTACSYNTPTIFNQYHANDLAHTRQAQENSLPQKLLGKSSGNNPLVAQCTNCDRIFTGNYCKRNLTRHEQLEHSDGEHPMYPCGELGCPRTFKRSDARGVHQRKAHPEMNLVPPQCRKRKSMGQ